MSEATGVGVEKLSHYAYAARQAGVSNEALAGALQKMQVEGVHRPRWAAGRMAGSVGALGSGDAADKLREFIKLAENMPTEERIGLARRMGLSELLPLA